MSVCHAVIVTAAGSSSRFNAAKVASSASGSPCASVCASVKKEFLKVKGKSILTNAVMPFLQVKGLALVLITYRKDSLQETKESLKGLDLPKGVELVFVEGGATRQESVFNALKELDYINTHRRLGIELVSIHDGARPFVKKETIEACLEAALKIGGAAPCVPVSDTLVRAEKGLLCGRLDRTNVYTVQTPQTFRFPEILRAHEAVAHEAVAQVVAREQAGKQAGEQAVGANNGLIYTDDTQIFTAYGFQVAIVEGDPKNKKITYPKDLE